MITINLPDLVKIEFVIPSVRIQEHLSDRVQQSITAPKESKRLLETAKQRVGAFKGSVATLRQEPEVQTFK